VVSYITFILGFYVSATIGPKEATIARAFRIGRIFRIIKKASFLRVIFNTIVITFPALANVGALLVLLLVIFSILGVQLFATVQLQTNLNVNANFQYFGIAFLSLLRFQTGESWNYVMTDLLT
jgi:Ion transport protein